MKSVMENVAIGICATVAICAYLGMLAGIFLLPALGLFWLLGWLK